jgi:hypothetical protein
VRETTIHDLFNAISCGVEEWALDGRVTYANPIREKSLECPDGQRLGQCAWETLAAETDRSRLRERIQNARESEDPLLPLSVITRDRSGSEFPEEIEWSRKRDPEGQVSGFIAIYHQNPSALGYLPPAGSGHSQELELLKAINLSIAHDLNSSLAVIVANTESLRPQTTLPDDPIRHHREQILEACERAKQLVQHIQSVGYEPAEPLQPVVLGSVVRQAVHWARSLLPTSCRIRCAIEAQHDQIAAFPRSLHRLLEIFCLRIARILVAIPATLEIRLQDRDIEADELKHFAGVLAPGACLCLTLTLESPALPAHDLQTVFEPYLNLRQSGLGPRLHLTMLHGTSRQHPIPDADEALRTLWETATVNQIIHEHRGALGLVQSETVSPKTTGIILLFPQNTPTRAVTAQTRPVAATPAPSQDPRARLLIAAPHDEFPLSFRERLEFLGYEMELMTSASRVQITLQEATTTFDAAIVYDSIAGSKTHALLKRMRELQANLPIIFCTRSPHKSSGVQPIPEVDEIIPSPKNWREIDLAIRRIRHEFPQSPAGKKPASPAAQTPSEGKSPQKGSPT